MNHKLSESLIKLSDTYNIINQASEQIQEMDLIIGKIEEDAYSAINCSDIAFNSANEALDIIGHLIKIGAKVGLQTKVENKAIKTINKNIKSAEEIKELLFKMESNVGEQREQLEKIIETINILREEFQGAIAAAEIIYALTPEED